MALERSVSLRQAVIYGVGVILGAGIYALIGSAAGISGNLLWLSFVIAAIIASLTAFSYAELSSYFPKESAESVYVKKAFNKKFLSFFIGFVALITTIFSVSTVAWGFATYFKFFFPLPAIIIALVIIVFCSLVNFLGIQESVKLNIVATFVETAGLLIIIVFGFRFIGAANLLEGPIGVTGIGLFSALFSSVALIFFAYLGFEGIANISEEVNSAKTTVPKAIILSLLIATIIYVLVAVIAVSAVSPLQLAAATNAENVLTQGPLALVAETVVYPGFGFWLSIMALFATFNTILILLVVASRLVYGMAKQNFLPRFFANTDKKTKTPLYAVFFVGLLSMAFIFAGNIEILGNLTTLGVFLMFFAVNASLIAVRYKENPKKINFISPLNIGRMPVLALIGAVFCIFMFLTQYWREIDIFGVEMPLIIFGVIIFLFSIPIYFYFNGKTKTMGYVASHKRKGQKKRKWAYEES